ncbi:MAG: TonB-dependent receptor [Pseudomonadota bacterium]
MPTSSNRAHARKLARTSGLIIALCCAQLSPALAQKSAKTEVPIAAQIAAQQEVRLYNIAGGSLSQVLTEFATQASISLSFDPLLLTNIQSQGLSGEYTLQEGFQTLLSGKGYEYMALGPGEYSIKSSRAGVMQLAPIKVQGELFERDIQDTLTSVISESGDQLRQRGEVSIDAFTSRMGNVNGASIRGIAVAGPSGTGRGQTVTTTIDGARISTFFDQNVDTYSSWDLAQVEVLRGPQSTQTGRNALAGSITIKSQDPIFEQEIKLGGQVGNNGTRQVAFAANTPVVDDVLAVRLSGEKLQLDSFIDYPNSTYSGDTDRETLRIGAFWQASDKITALLKVQKVDQEEPNFGFDRVTWPDERTSTAVIASSFTKDLISWNLELSFEISDSVTLESNSNYTEFDTLFATGFDTPIGAFATPRFGVNQSLEQEFRLYYETDNLKSVVGIFYTDIEQGSSVRGNLPAIALLDPATIIALGANPFTATFAGELNQSTITENAAIFGELEWEFSKGKRLILGMRYDDEEQDANSTNTGQLIDGDIMSGSLPLGPEEQTNASYEAWLPKIGFAYDLDENQTIGVTYQRGYRAGGSRINFGATPFFTYSFDPEYTDNLDLAYRSTWYDGGLTVNANLFYIDWKDQQVTVQQDPADSADFIIDNSGASQLWGGELEIRSTVLEHTEFYTSIGYSNTEFTEFVASVGDLSGNEFISAPDWTAAFGGTYFINDDWEIAGDLTYTGSTFSDIDNIESNKNDSYWLASIRATKVIGNGFEITAYVNNLFDEEFTTFQSAVLVTAGTPRTYGIQGQYIF